ncbi:MAG: 30S ribosomal protein S6 [Ignavibacteriae bacterium]|nr:30S ribosomal protein S6 [Ignavibacteriota bacterium]MCB9242734.1 30S ribosomal protein S6 [Ignavibacteriales bacterium]
MANRYYESYIIVDGNYEDSQVEEIVTRYEKFLKDHNAEIKELERIGRKRLAYPIKKRLNGFYICYEFLAEPELIKELEMKYKVDDEILRFLTVQTDEKTLERRAKHFKRKAEELAKAEAESKEEAKQEGTPEGKTDNRERKPQAEAVK